MIKAERSANVTPCRAWDYIAWFQGREELYTGNGATTNKAIEDLQTWAKGEARCIHCGSDEIEEFKPREDFLVTLCHYCHKQENELIDVGEAIERAQYKEGK